MVGGWVLDLVLPRTPFGIDFGVGGGFRVRGGISLGLESSFQWDLEAVGSSVNNLYIYVNEVFF